MAVKERNLYKKPLGWILLSVIGISSCDNQTQKSTVDSSPNYPNVMHKVIRAPRLVEATITELQESLKIGDFTCRDIVQGYIDRINAYDQPAGINAITEINANALTRADETDVALTTGKEMPPLFCAPLLVKDNFDTSDMVTSGGSIALRNSKPEDDAFMIRKLKEAGAIVLAKTNMAEWAFSPRESISSSYGRTANAYDVNYVPAGSSGGTASGVAASFGVAGMGSDTGNSIRGPSSHLALFGLRSTLGLTSRDGVIPLNFDRDIAGPMARTVEDGVRLFNVIAGYDPNDPLVEPNRREENYLEFLNVDGLTGKRLGVLRNLVDQEGADPEIKLIFEDALLSLAEAGAEIVDPFSIEDFRSLSDAIPFCPRFRYDAAQYLRTLSSPPINDVSAVLETNEISDEARSRLTFYSKYPMEISPDEWEEPCITWPNNPLRNQLLHNVVTSMDATQIDAIIFPTWSNPPAHIDRGVEEYAGDNSQLLAPDAGLPALTIPMGFWREHLPAGLQFVGRPYSEGALIEMAYSFEQATHYRRPPAGYAELDKRKHSLFE
tara:strand:+ start:2976 stop:4628 length:1653 start_codon:yes stop_codon:yes gene_type:complete